jgi:hypothetical protein
LALSHGKLGGLSRGQALADASINQISFNLQQMSRNPMQTAIPCLFMRGGTSRGAFFKAGDLPADPRQGVVGGDGFARRIDQ